MTPRSREFTDDVTVARHPTEEYLLVRVTEDIDDEALTAAAEEDAPLGVERAKDALVEEAVVHALQAEAPEVFHPQVRTTVEVETTYSVDLAL
jgi:predicted hydrolase (HD superfamily)